VDEWTVLGGLPMTNGQQPMQFQMPTPSRIFTPAVTILLVLMAAGYVLMLAAPRAIEWLGLVPDAITRGQMWQLVSYVFGERFAMNLLFNAMAVLFIGNMIEREWRARSLAGLWLSASIVCGLIWTAVNLLAGKNGVGFGAGPCVYALLGAFGLLFGKRRFFFFVAAVQARWIAAILIGLGLLMSLGRPISIVWIIGAPVGYLYIALVRRLASRPRSGDAGPSSRTRHLEID
jgi:membrane associated rhomboid family serine protease